MIHPPPSLTEHLAFNTARFGRIVSVDFRDRQYLLRPKLAARSTRTSRYWSPSTVLDQGDTPQCVSYAGEAFLKSGPVLNLQYKIPQNLYDQCQSVDEWAVTPHDGTSVRALFKILQSHGYVTEYNWAFDIDTVVQFVLERGPVVFGTDWYDSQYDVVSRDFIQISDNAQVVGGHAYLICGVNTIMGCPDGSTGALRMQNSWASDWGDYGQAWMSLRDATRLLKDWGEAATSAELFSLGDK
jgi:hypothetical protein